MNVAVSMDGNFSETFDLYVIHDIKKVKGPILITPNCGDIYGDIECIIKDESDHILNYYQSRI